MFEKVQAIPRGLQHSRDVRIHCSFNILILCRNIQILYSFVLYFHRCQVTQDSSHPDSWQKHGNRVCPQHCRDVRKYVFLTSWFLAKTQRIAGVCALWALISGTCTAWWQGFKVFSLGRFFTAGPRSQGFFKMILNNFFRSLLLALFHITFSQGLIREWAQNDIFLSGFTCFIRGLAIFGAGLGWF